MLDLARALRKDRALLTAAIALTAVLWMIIAPDLASAADTAPDPNSTLALPSVQLWTLAIGALVPLVTYVVNHFAPWASEPVKAAVVVVASAVAGGIYQAIEAGQVGFNGTTAQFILTAVIGALAAHKLLWAPAGISTRLGGGSNRDVVARAE
jgi:hypothetical protein